MENYRTVLSYKAVRSPSSYSHCVVLSKICSCNRRSEIIAQRADFQIKARKIVVNLSFAGRQWILNF